MIPDRPYLEGTSLSWDDNANANIVRETEWSNISNEFTNAGYREGIVAGKESTLQEGFDAGFASVGVPLGRKLGNLRGVISAVLSVLGSQPDSQPSADLLIEAREIAAALANIRFSDIAPPDLEAEQHAREHLDKDDLPLGAGEESEQKRKLESLEDMMQNMGAGNPKDRPTAADVTRLEARLDSLGSKLGLHDA